MRLPLGYPSREAEREIVVAREGSSLVEELQPVLTVEEVIRLQRDVEAIHCSETLVEYLLTIVSATRDDRELRLGVSPRGAQAYLRAARALALTEGRDFVLPDDVQRLGVPVLAHRVVVVDPIDGVSDNRQAEAVIRRVLADTPVPA